MSKRVFRGVVLGAVVLVIGIGAVSAAGGDARNFRASPLTGYEENPDISTTGGGSWSATLSNDGTTLRFTLRFSNLEGNVTQSHIHFAKRAVNGGVSMWLCGTAATPGPTGTPACPAPGVAVSGELTADDVVGPSAQGIDAGEFDEILAAMRAGHAYVNVHSSTYPGGEIRAQIRVVR